MTPDSLTSAAQTVADLWRELENPLHSGRFESALEALAAASDAADQEALS